MYIDFVNSLTGNRSADNFGKQLFDLIFKADPNNLLKLFKAFPKEVTFFRWWQKTSIQPSDRKIRFMCAMIENIPTDYALTMDGIDEIKKGDNYHGSKN